MAYVLKALAFIRSRLLLIILGLGCEALYILYFVRVFPLLQYYQALHDITTMVGRTHAGFLTYIVVFSILFTFFGFAWWETRSYNDRATLYLILGFGGIFALTMVFVYPITAIDVYDYIAESLVLVQYHANPIMVPAVVYASHDAFINSVGGWTHYGSPYGPLGLIIDSFPTQIVGRNLLANLLLIKVMFSSMLIAEAFLVYKILTRIAPKLALAGALFIAWNPYALSEFSANSHNDIAMMLFVLLAVLALVYDRPLLAFVLIVAAALVKYAILPVVPMFFIYGIVHQPTKRKRMAYLALATLSALLLVIAIAGPFWDGLKTLNPLLSQDQRYEASFSTMLTDISSGQLTLDKAKLVGRILFGISYLYALLLSRKDFLYMIYGCFIALFSLLALGVTNFEIWYAIWPVMFAVLLPNTMVTMSMLLLLYAASLKETFDYFLLAWLGFTDSAFDIRNSTTYLLIFMPTTLIFFCLRLRKMLSIKSVSELHPQVTQKHLADQKESDRSDMDESFAVSR